MKITCKFETCLVDNGENEIAVEEYTVSRDFDCLSNEEIRIFTKEVVGKLSKIVE